MAPEILYLLKVNIAIALFYAFYRLLFHKDTFFHWRRIVLLSFFAISLVYPLLNIQDWIKSQEPILAMTDIYAAVILPEVEIMPATTEVSSVSWHTFIIYSFKYLYLGICLFMMSRLIIQLFLLFKLALQTKIKYIGNIKIHLIKDGYAPFSFFHWIFVNPEDHSEDELKEILVHEQTHARQWHSLDVIISELMCIFCWFNPFIWLLKREIRENLEYLADNKVLEKGYDSKTYQYHLLGLSHQTKVATLYNNFNVLPLKKRIKMMNKKRTSKIGTTKYFLFPLLAAALLIISNIDAIARTTEAVIQDLTTLSVTEAVVPVESEKTEAILDVDQEVEIFEIVENMPEFPGGQEALFKFLSENIRYPESARKNGIQGKVSVQFVVGKNGVVRDPRIVRSVNPELEKEALRVIGLLPNWKPGTQRGQAVDVKYTVPVTFSLGTQEKTAPPPPPIPIRPEDMKPDANGVYEIVEEMPQFPGGQKGLTEFLGKNIKYPVDAISSGTKGRVVIQVVIDTDGTVKNPQITRSVSASLDEEALRVVKSMPKWKPGKMSGKNVPVKYTIPIVFSM